MTYPNLSLISTSVVFSNQKPPISTQNRDAWNNLWDGNCILFLEFSSHSRKVVTSESQLHYNYPSNLRNTGLVKLSALFCGYLKFSSSQGESTFQIKFHKKCKENFWWFSDETKTLIICQKFFTAACVHDWLTF